MSSLTPASSDISAELLLNKLMNNQVKSSTGKTVTAAGRAMSSKLNSMGYEVGSAAGVVASGQGYVIAAQDQVTSMLTKLQEMQKLFAGTATNFSTAGASAGVIWKELATMEKAKLDGITLLKGGTGKVLDAGMGNKISILTKAVGTGLGKLSALKAYASTGGFTAGNKDAALTAIDEAIAQLTGYVADYGSSYNLLRDRVTVLNDLGKTFVDSAAEQTLTGGGGTSALLANVLGTSSV